MKAFVIKNKEGKYWNFLFNNESEFFDEIYNAFMHYSRADAEKDITLWSLKDCEVVEVEINEVDEKSKEIIQCRKQVCEEIYNYIMDNWEDLMGIQGRYQNFNGTCADLKEDLEKIAKG